MRQNGLLAVPHALIDAIVSFVFAVNAAQPTNQQRMNALLRDDPKDPWAAEIKQDYALFRRLGLGRAKLTRFGAGYTAKIKVSFAGMEKHYPTEEMLRLNPTMYLVVGTAMSTSLPNVFGGFSGYEDGADRKGRRGKNELYISLPVHENYAKREGTQNSWEGYQEIKGFLRDTIEHEVMHFLQAALADALGFKGENMTLDDLQARYEVGLKGFDPKHGRRVPFGGDGFMQLVEYFPWMRDSFSLTKRHVDRLQKGRAPGDPRFMTLQDFDDSYAGAAKMVRTLKSKAPDRYKRWRQEQSAFMAQYNEKLRAKERPLRITPARLVSELLRDLDIADPALAAYTRAHRDYFISVAKDLI